MLAYLVSKPFQHLFIGYSFTHNIEAYILRRLFARVNYSELYALGLPADKGFIHFHDASQQLAIVHHGLAYPVHHRPDRS